MSRSIHGGRHELGQNFLNHQPTITRITALVHATRGPILEIGAGDGALTRILGTFGRPLTAIELDEHRAQRLRRTLPGVRVEHADVLNHPLDAAVIVGNIPFHLTTPILRQLLAASRWQEAFLLTQWEVARKRAGVGGGTMMTAQSAPWFEFTLHGRVPARCFTPQPSVDGGILGITRRARALVPYSERAGYEAFVRAVYTGSGAPFASVLQRAARCDATTAAQAMMRADIAPDTLPRDLAPHQWAGLWMALRPSAASALRRRPRAFSRSKRAG